MINLQSIVLQLEEETYTNLCKNLDEKKAEKFGTLLRIFRENVLPEEEIIQNLDVNINAFYTLKSRLFDKIQNHLTDSLKGPKVDLLRKVANIPTLLFNTNRDIALAILLKLEKDLQDYDMPYELTNVYGALKKLHLHSAKYYEYSQLYNKHVAFTLALDKAEDMIANFHQKLGEYQVSKDKTILDHLTILKQEMSNLCRLYKSHHLIVYQSIIDISCAIFVPMELQVKEDEPVEDIISGSEKIFETYYKDTSYQYLCNVISFLTFEYYHQLKLHKKESSYFEIINNNLASFLLYNHCAFTSKFLLSKIERYIYQEREADLYEESKELRMKYIPDLSDHPNFINYQTYLAVCAYYSKNFQEAISILNGLINEVGFKNYPHAEIDVKLFLALCYSLINKYDQTERILRSVSRKIREVNEELEYEHANIFTKMLKLQMGNNGGDTYTKLIKLRNRFNQLNEGTNTIMKYLKTDDAFILFLSQNIKKS